MKKILIDLDKVYESEDFKNARSEIKTFVEYLIRITVCRHCDDAPCIKACPWNALKKDEDLERAFFLCTGCKTCLFACPFGVNIDEMVEYKVKSYDIEKLRSLASKLSFVETGDFQEEDDIVMVEEGVYVKTFFWRKQLGLRKI